MRDAAKWDCFGDKSGVWLPWTVPDSLYLGTREWYYPLKDMSLDNRSLAYNSARAVDKAIETMVAVKI